MLRIRVGNAMMKLRLILVLQIIEELFCLLFYVRDISHGLGKRSIFYMMMMCFYDSFPMLALSVYPILLEYYKPLPYGSWRDVVGLCKFLKHNSSRGENHPLVDSVLEYMCKQLKNECIYFARFGKCDSNLVKWIPQRKIQKRMDFLPISYYLV